jgi:hypothetical protein
VSAADRRSAIEPLHRGGECINKRSGTDNAKRDRDARSATESRHSVHWMHVWVGAIVREREREKKQPRPNQYESSLSLCFSFFARRVCVGENENLPADVRCNQ